MNNKIILTSAIAASIVAAGYFLYHARLPIAFDGLIGYMAVLSVAGVAALEYRLHGRRAVSKR